MIAPIVWAAPAITDDRREADRLFDEGKVLFDRGSFAAACSRFEASLALAPGIGARLWLGECYESMGRTASAQKQFRAAAEQAAATGDKREEVATKRANLLEARVVKIAIKVESPAPDEHALLDGAAVDGDALVAVDPGRHVVTATAPGHLPWTLAFDASAPERVVTIAIPPLASPARPPPPPAAPPEPPPRANPWRTVGFAAGSAGLVGLAASGVLGLLAIDAKGAYHRACDGTVCPQEGHDDGARALHEANAATVALAAGAALLATGVVLVVVSPTASSRVAVSPAGLVMHGTF